MTHTLKTYLRVRHADVVEPKGLRDDLVLAFGNVWFKDPYGYRTQYNLDYDVDVNNMLRVTLAPFFGKEEEIKRVCDLYRVSFVLEIIPELCASSEDPTPILSLDNDIIKFLYLSGVEHDLDLYIYR